AARGQRQRSHREEKRALLPLVGVRSRYAATERPLSHLDLRRAQEFRRYADGVLHRHAFGKSMTAQLPVMDHRNKAIANPDAFAVNTAMQRCLAKAIALHGLGLYIYAGEDLPE